ncbi:hypothetical protein B0H13DRAFT_2057462 [Mycena leptocephala]|nr:hypothetical protein B0H13DRAFT_2057462 [Mycena leptocephala]
MRSCAFLCASSIAFLSGPDLPLWAASARRRWAMILSMHLGRRTRESAAGTGGAREGKAARWGPLLGCTLASSYDASSHSPRPIRLHPDVDSAATRPSCFLSRAVVAGLWPWSALHMCQSLAPQDCSHAPACFYSIHFAIIRSSSSPLPAPCFPRSDELRVWAAVILRRTSSPFLLYRSPYPARLRVCGESADSTIAFWGAVPLAAFTGDLSISRPLLPSLLLTTSFVSQLSSLHPSWC